MTIGMALAMLFSVYCTMIIMTYIGLYIYDYKRKISESHESKGRDWFLEYQRNERRVFSFLWPASLPIMLGMNIGIVLSYISGNFFVVLDTIAAKIVGKGN